MPEITLFRIEDLSEHPDNALIYATDAKADEELRRSIQREGIITPIAVNKRPDGELRILSGHRRVKSCRDIGEETIRGEQYDALSDAQELLILFDANIGRDMKDCYKIRFYKAVKQYLRQEKNRRGIPTAYENSMDADSPFSAILRKRGVDTTKMLMSDVIEQITGFSEYEQKILTHVCDEEYRAEILSKIPTSVPMKAISKVGEVWAEIEREILAGITTIAQADKEIVKLLKEIENIKNPPPKKERRQKQSKPENQEAVSGDDTFVMAMEWLQKQGRFKNDADASVGYIGVAHYISEFVKYYERKTRKQAQEEQ